MSSYIRPTWCRPPPSSSEWKLDEIKNGIIVDSHIISTSIVAFGRAADLKGADVINITTAHESCSRLHARIAFDATGVPWLRDLGSGNGTKVNKKSVPEKSRGKVENLKGEGSRGVIVYPADQLQFGASTRVYVLDGPQEYERGALEARNKQVALMKTLATSTPASTNKTESDIIAEIKNPSSISATGDVRADEPAQVSEKHRKLLERIQAKKYKQSNIQLEMQRIQSKAMSAELTAVQSSQLEKLEGRDTLLTKEIEDLEATMSEKIHQASNSIHAAVAKRKKTVSTSNYDEDLDSLYDRTSTKRSRGGQSQDKSVAETEESLVEKCIALFDRMKHKKGVLQEKEKKANAIAKELQSTGKDDDEYFFVNNKLELMKEEFKVASDAVRSIDKDITEIEAILKFSDSKIVIDRELMFVGSEPKYAQRRSEINEQKLKEESKGEFHIMMPPPMIKPRGALEKSGIDNMMPPPSHSSTSSQSKRIQGARNNDSDAEGSTIRETRGLAVKVHEEIVEEPKLKEPIKEQKIITGPMRPPPGNQGTLSIVKELLLEKGATRIKHAGCNNARDYKRSDSKKQKTWKKMDPKIDEWVAPSNQDGSGETKLNAKFRGRY